MALGTSSLGSAGLYRGQGLANSGLAFNSAQWAIATNNNSFPYTNTSSTNFVRNNGILRRVPSNSGFKNLRFTYTNWLVQNGAESNGTIPITLRMGVRDASGRWHMGTVAGQQDWTLQPGESVTFVTDCNVSAGDDILEVCRVVGQSGSQSYLLNQGVVAHRGGFSATGTDATVDLTMGGETANDGIGFGAVVTAVMSADTVNSVTVNQGGNLYGSGSNTNIYFLTTTSAMTTGANYATTLTSHVVTGGFKNGAGSGFDATPSAVVRGGGSTAPADTQVYAASVVSGIPTNPRAVNIVGLGDSILRGFGSSDGFGDLVCNWGVTERAFNSSYGFMNLGVPSMTSTAYVRTKQYALLDSLNIKWSAAIIALGINDITGGATFATLSNSNINHANEWRRRGAKIIFSSLAPSTTGSWAAGSDPVANQTPRTGAGAGGVKETYNAAVRNGTNGLLGDYACFDIGAQLEYPGQTQYWRTDLAFAVTGDGIHPSGDSSPKSGTTYNFINQKGGIRYAAANITVPTINF